MNIAEEDDFPVGTLNEQFIGAEVIEYTLFHFMNFDVKLFPDKIIFYYCLDGSFRDHEPQSPEDNQDCNEAK